MQVRQELWQGYTYKYKFLRPNNSSYMDESKLVDTSNLILSVVVFSR